MPKFHRYFNSLRKIKHLIFFIPIILAWILESGLRLCVGEGGIITYSYVVIIKMTAEVLVET